jgi:hypothetical protein
MALTRQQQGIMHTSSSPNWMRLLRILAVLGLLNSLWSGQAVAQQVDSARDLATKGLRFSHNDWEVACDNTRTCRAAGYQGSETDPPVSLLLIREAGVGTRVRAHLTLGDIEVDDSGPLAKAEQLMTLRLRVNGKALGALTWRQADEVYELSQAQVRAVLQALPQPRARIEVHAGHDVWRVSDRGAYAVLLKMDEAQGRIGTPGALVRRGQLDGSRVSPALPMPVVKAARVPTPPAGQPSARLPGLSPAEQAALQQELLADTPSELMDADEEPAFSFYPLGSDWWLASTLCWSAAYNRGDCMWVIRQAPPHRPELVTDMASDYDNGVITASHKGRGIGDCWGHEAWTWDGRAFVHTSAFDTGMCKLVRAGGTWNLPTRVTRVVQP